MINIILTAIDYRNPKIQYCDHRSITVVLDNPKWAVQLLQYSMMSNLYMSNIVYTSVDSKVTKSKSIQKIVFRILIERLL